LNQANILYHPGTHHPFFGTRVVLSLGISKALDGSLSQQSAETQ
jgi:hypothetical protein